MNQVLRARIEHLVKTLERKRFFVTEEDRQQLKRAKAMLLLNPSDAEIAKAYREIQQERTTA